MVANRPQQPQRPASEELRLHEKFQPPSFNTLVVNQEQLEQTFLLYKLRSTKLLFEESEVDRISSWLF